MKMKITNVSSKNVTLLNGTTIKPRQTVTLTVVKNSDLYIQIKNLERLRILMVK